MEKGEEDWVRFDDEKVSKAPTAMLRPEAYNSITLFPT